jgi:hypothetical protein
MTRSLSLSHFLIQRFLSCVFKIANREKEASWQA